jgi:hypothetical protein
MHSHIFRVHLHLVKDGLARAVVDVQFHDGVGVRDGQLLHRELCSNGLKHEKVSE